MLSLNTTEFVNTEVTAELGVFEFLADSAAPTAAAKREVDLLRAGSGPTSSSLRADEFVTLEIPAKIEGPYRL